MIKSRDVDKYLIKLISNLGWRVALDRFKEELRVGKIEDKQIKVDNDDYVEIETNTYNKKIQETYFITVESKVGTEKDIIFIDECDFSRVFEYDWWIKRDENGKKLAVTNIDGKFISLQQFILGIPKPGSVIVFLDGNRLNVKRNNMRFKVINKVENLKYRNKQGYSFD